MEEKLTGIKCSTKDTEKYMVLKKDKIILAFVDDIKNGVITMHKANHEQNRL